MKVTGQTRGPLKDRFNPKIKNTLHPPLLTSTPTGLQDNSWITAKSSKTQELSKEEDLDKFKVKKELRNKDTRGI